MEASRGWLPSPALITGPIFSLAGASAGVLDGRTLCLASTQTLTVVLPAAHEARDAQNVARLVQDRKHITSDMRPAALANDTSTETSSKGTDTP